MQCPRCQRENRADATFCDKCSAPLQHLAGSTQPAPSYADVERALGEALQRQTATSEILQAISQAQTDAQHVFDAIARSTVRLCEGARSTVWRPEGDLFRCVARSEMTPEGRVVSAPRGETVGADALLGKAFHDRQILRVNDAREDPTIPPQYRERARLRGYRSLMAVPMLREGLAVGVITVVRPASGEFSDQQVGLVKTFADQAVIAIENVRLFQELQSKNHDLTDALERQTATSEILNVISASPTDVHPVFEAICKSAVRLFGAYASALIRFDGELMQFGAVVSPSAEADERYRLLFPRPPDRELATGQSILDRAIVHVPDTERDTSRNRELGRDFGYRRLLVVPMTRGAEAVGALAVTGREPGSYSNGQIELLKTFAGQAVIAIENTRLFTELQASNRDLTTALDTQTATSDILRVISRSQTDAQPVFDAIVASAVRLLEADSGLLTRITGDQIEIAALTSTDPAGDAILRAAYPLSRHSDRVHARVIRDRAPLNVADAQTDPRLPDVQHATARARGYRSHVAVPLLRHDEALGAIAVTRHAPGGFTDDEIALLQTFADQAVIAIENARLLSELQARTQDLTRSVEQLTALGEVGRAVISSLDLDTVLTTIVGRAVQLSGTDGGTIFEYDESAEEFTARATLNVDEGQSAMVRATRLRRGEGAVGQMAVTREALQIGDISAEGAYVGRLRGALLAAGTRSVLAIPLLNEERLVGGLVVTRRTPGEFTADVIELLKTFASQSALAIQNARLFREIEEKSRQLEVASQHKSEFLANMSHELRTPLNAIIGFSEVLTDRMFGELNEKQEEYLKDIYASGTHLLSLINDILDLSKIEAGRMELELTDFDLPQAIDNAVMLVRERAGRRGIALEHSVDERLGEIRGDERKVKQVLLNLLSNALKFTPEGGRVEVRAGMADGMAEISVTDTGVGIAPEDQGAIFEEFRQVGTADKKAEGTGLGLTLCRKFVELHGGKIWVKSEPGMGSTFTFTIPVRRGE